LVPITAYIGFGRTDMSIDHEDYHIDTIRQRLNTLGGSPVVDSPIHYVCLINCVHRTTCFLDNFTAPD
jgi:cell division FtsZ-interacting protein ZapD